MTARDQPDKVHWLRSTPFFLMHAACLLAFWLGVSWPALATCVFLYWTRMFGITAGYHRYFAHASFKTGRAFQFALALLGSMAMQKGPLWWAAHHRHHHANSDEADDIHSPIQRGFWWSHMGWFLCVKYDETRWNLVQNLARYRELRWLNSNHPVPGLALALAVFLFGWYAEIRFPEWGATRWQMLLWGWLISTVLLYHGTFSINSLAHVFGGQPYPTRDGSRNNPLLAVVTLGEGWHNNHHYAPSSARMGFRWWEIDQSYYVLKALSWLGVVWDLRNPPRTK